MAGKISRRRFLNLTATGIAATTVSLMTTTQTVAAKKDKRPNIILIMVDDMGFSDVGCYGGEILTPNIDRLAKNGMRFTQFYNNAKCAPTRASLLTGLYSQQVKVAGEGNSKETNCVTIAEVLDAAGYRTLMAGKWHRPGMPVERGFDRHFGLLDGACNFFNPGHARPGEKEPARKFADQEHRWAIEDKVYQPYTPPEKDFYTTDAFTDYAIGYLDEYKNEDKPFFLYMAYNAPHYPMHAWPEDIAKYRGKYMVGWEKIRKQRFKRQQKMGLINKACKISPANDETPAWKDIEDKDAWDLKMAVYAAMVDRVDQNIGRLLDKVRRLGEEDNTLVMFLSDNGGSSESYHVNPEVPPGKMEGFHTVDLPWGNASNTPFRKFKGWDHEGGISTPLIAHWPKRIKPGQITHQTGHMIDLMSTCLAVGGARYPKYYQDRKICKTPGKSLVPIFNGRIRKGHDAIFWQHQKSKAVRQGKYKIVTVGDEPWHLYDMDVDRTELNDLSQAQPERVKSMVAMWDRWAKRVGFEQPAPKKKKTKQNKTDI